MNKKEILYDRILNYVMSMKLDSYHTLFLANLILRTMNHPEEKMAKSAEKVMKRMRHIYKKKDLLEISPQKSLDKLEEVVDNCNNIPEDWKTGQILYHVVGKISQVINESYE